MGGIDSKAKTRKRVVENYNNDDTHRASWCIWLTSLICRYFVSYAVILHYNPKSHD